ncbi:MAG: TonB family protein [Candidatus Omnitrophica bacterium]|nr:TonB family protein [Candidatus Omnitrophota bacterium]
MNFRYTEDVDKTFKTTLLFSAVLHIFLLFNWPFYRHIFTDRKKPGNIEITYLKPEVIREKPEQAPKRSVPQPEVSKPAKLVEAAKPEEKAKAEAAKKEAVKAKPAAPEGIAPVQKEPSRAKVVIKQPVVPRIQATASVDMQGLRLMPTSYSQTVRNKIISRLDTMKSGVEGEVYVRFIVTSDGGLKDIRIVDEKSSTNGFLRSAAFAAVRDAAPFAEFPAGVNLPEIAFTCEISFTRK